MVKLAELSTEDLFSSGHRLCSGCGPAIAMRMATKGFRGPTIVTQVTGCVEVSSTVYPQTAWKVPWAHLGFENAAAAASGVEAALKAFTKKGKLTQKIDVVAIGGDGGTFDIGLQALSGALERRHDFIYICYDNEAYMNTGIQRSGSTPLGAWTTTSPVGKKQAGKLQWKKDLIGIVVAHGVEFAATASIAYWNDYITKVRKALEVEGPAFIHVIAPCPLGWRTSSDETINLARLAVQTRIFPVYEVTNWKYKLNINVTSPKLVEEYFKTQGRFRHMLNPENKELVDLFQYKVDENWNRLQKLCSL